ncbi:hypothetical protein CEXT_763681 [Caerostris extrusa]|uniref:Uncharacterized protein n=1 Tax=Caerostris extrusa TaxID=172846 RepID=A0AAV4WCS2_CAEEX|nr:hypothetical protein CEXT_763681 [Caerostris extrusa]
MRKKKKKKKKRGGGSKPTRIVHAQKLFAYGAAAFEGGCVCVCVLVCVPPQEKCSGKCSRVAARGGRGENRIKKKKKADRPGGNRQKELEVLTYVLRRH